MSQIITVTFAEGQREAIAAQPLEQWAYGQTLQFEGLDLPQAYRVDFSNFEYCGASIPRVGGPDGVAVPVEVLTSGRNVYAFIWVQDETSGARYRRATVRVVPGPEPDTDESPEEQSAVTEAINALNNAVEAIPAEIQAAMEEAKQSGEYDGNRIWYSTIVPDKITSTISQLTFSQLSGVPDATPQIGDLVVAPEPAYYPTPAPITGTPTFLLVISDTPVGHQLAKLTSVGSLRGIRGADGVGVPSGGATGQVLKKASGTDYDTEWADESGGGGGTSDYSDLINKPQIAGVTLSGNKSLADLGIAAASDIPTVPVQSVNGKTGAVVLNASDVGAGTYSKPSDGIPKSDLASAVQASLGKADTALQSAPVASVNGQTGDVLLSIPSTAADVGAIAAPEGGSVGQVLKKTASGAEWADESGGGLSAAVKAALIQIAQQVAYIDDQGQTYFEDLRDALYTLNSISAVYTQGEIIYTNTPLNDLKATLVVTANYSDSYTEIVPDADYTLSGTLTAGTSTITVSYSGKTTTFTVTVTQYRQPLYSWDFTQSLTDSIGGLTMTLANSNGGSSYPTQDSTGLHFTAGEQIAAAPQIYIGLADGKLYEFDISSAVFAGNTNKHKRLFNAGSDNLLIFRNAGELQIYRGAWMTLTAEPGKTIPTTLDELSGKTVGIKLGTDKTFSLFIGGELIATRANWVAVNYTGNYTFRFGGNSSGTAADGNDIHNLTITGFRIYQEE